MALVLVRVTGTTPASDELATDFTTGSNAILQTLLSLDELGGLSAVGDTFSYDALALRHQFNRPQSNTEEIDESEEIEVN
jgi:hypothetical protein